MRLRNFVSLSALLSVFVLGTCITAHADEYSYTFSGDEMKFSLTSPTLITTTDPDPLSATSCSYFGEKCSEIIVGATGVPIYISDGITDNPGFEFFDSKGNEVGAIADTLPSSFFTVGTHTYDGLTLTITDISSAPEPSSLALMATAVLGLGGLLKRRLA